jgi:hypothetical protein
MAGQLGIIYIKFIKIFHIKNFNNYYIAYYLSFLVCSFRKVVNLDLNFV